ncbi:hypothetical protein Leryth_025512 [Lithospermum erythrorhizon]|nr:hypothetical protein Leryth_025512 [Lithospermum erythrorhizon]
MEWGGHGWMEWVDYSPSPQGKRVAQLEKIIALERMLDEAENRNLKWMKTTRSEERVEEYNYTYKVFEEIPQMHMFCIMFSYSGYSP